jgi:hypothetical protein
MPINLSPHASRRIAAATKHRNLEKKSTKATPAVPPLEKLAKL